MTTDKLFDEAAAAGRNGYPAELLGQRVDRPTIVVAWQDDAVLFDGSEIIPDTHFSLAAGHCLVDSCQDAGGRCPALVLLGRRGSGDGSLHP